MRRRWCSSTVITRPSRWPPPQAADAAGVPVVLDAGSWKPVLPELLPHVTAAVCSADFALPGVAGDPDATARALLAAGPGFVAVTGGAGAGAVVGGR